MIFIGAWRIYRFSKKSTPSVNSFSYLYWAKNVIKNKKTKTKKKQKKQNKTKTKQKQKQNKNKQSLFILLYLISMFFFDI